MYLSIEDVAHPWIYVGVGASIMLSPGTLFGFVLEKWVWLFGGHFSLTMREWLLAVAAQCIGSF